MIYLKKVIKMKDVYIDSCSKNGGILHFKSDKESMIFVKKYSLDRPMYHIKEKNKMYVILREPFDDTNESGLVTFDINEDGSLSNMSKIVSTGGVCACHLCRFNGSTYVVNYLSGNVVKIGGRTDTHTGVGINLPRQDMPHTHYITPSPDGRELLVTDLGLDEIFVYDGDLNVKKIIKCVPGYGVRHLAFSDDGKYMYSVNELKSSVSVFSVNSGNYNYIDTYPSLPEEYEGINTAAAIRVYNGYLYVSNRGHNSIAIFKIEKEFLKLKGFADCGGNGPRDFNIFDGYMAVTNEDSSNVSLFSVDGSEIRKCNYKYKADRVLCIG